MELSYKEFEILTYFSKTRESPLSREKILNNVWNYDYYGDAAPSTPCQKTSQQNGDKGDLIKTIWAWAINSSGRIMNGTEKTK